MVAHAFWPSISCPGIAGSTASFVGSPRLSAGASGAIFGLLGATIAYFATYREQFGARGRRQLSSMLIVAGYNLVFGFIATGIDNFAHVGGLLAGLLIGWAYCPRYHLALSTAVGGRPRSGGSFPASAGLASLAGWFCSCSCYSIWDAPMVLTGT